MRKHAYAPLRAVAVAILMPLAALSLAACATNPATGESQLSLISEAQEIAMGREAAGQVQASLGLVDDRALQEYVHRVGTALAAASERPNLPWSFAVVDDPTPNAFALPGGFIFVTRGMMSLMMSEAELASVLGHEIGHVTARHSVNQLSRQQLAQLGLGLGGVLVPEVQQVAPLVSGSLGLLFLKYGRDDEREADELGFGYARQRGYASSEFGEVFAALERTAGDAAGAVPDWLSTHPAPAERVETARRRAAEAGPQPGATVGREDYLGRIDGLVFGDDPRHGFFRDGVFYHPELRFQVRLPQGWEGRNMAQAVVAGAPDGAAVFELTLADGSPDDALAQLRQQGAEVGRSVRESINGLRALTAPFSAETPQGSIRGTAAFIDYGGRTYRLLGYAAAPAFAAAEPALTAALGSFDRVSDPAVLSVQPMRIDVVSLDRAQTLADVASEVPAERLAILNHVASATTRLAAGTTIKRVVS
jgi:predicted Zn-dependent protease